MPLFKLQTVGSERLDFLYSNVLVKVGVELKPGVCFCFRLFHPLLEELVRGAWLRFVRALPSNQALLGDVTDLSAFMFGTEREDLQAYRPVLLELQNGVCFYCTGILTDTNQVVDHFVPWATYQVDLGHNFVLAHARCNNAKSATLAAVQHLERWFDRNAEHGPRLAEFFDERGLLHNLAASRQVTRWAYANAHRARAQVWVAGRDYEPLGDEWRGIAGAL
jgi:5-methylcytosine-specific restriction endonuclease McrA